MQNNKKKVRLTIIICRYFNVLMPSKYAIIPKSGDKTDTMTITQYWVLPDFSNHDTFAVVKNH